MRRRGSHSLPTANGTPCHSTSPQLRLPTSCASACRCWWRCRWRRLQTLRLPSCRQRRCRCGSYRGLCWWSSSTCCASCRCVVRTRPTCATGWPLPATTCWLSAEQHRCRPTWRSTTSCSRSSSGFRSTRCQFRCLHTLRRLPTCSTSMRVPRLPRQVVSRPVVPTFRHLACQRQACSTRTQRTTRRSPTRTTRSPPPSPPPGPPFRPEAGHLKYHRHRHS
mmetsp:Transcript_2143/g.6791  ORF Transcript_2143/g.6791 Transcript_2143/m.6791 type:complete len:221 (-) Transcript_2143:190-852(-)